MNSFTDDIHRYDDIINEQHPVSKNHPPMPMENRAAQFLPFAALTGYDAAIRETARMTDMRLDLDEDDKLLLSSKLQLIQDQISARPEVAVTCGPGSELFECRECRHSRHSASRHCHRVRFRGPRFGAMARAYSFNVTFLVTRLAAFLVGRGWPPRVRLTRSLG